MHAFNLTRLNFHSPYKVWIDKGSYKFLTDYGVTGDSRQAMRARLFTRWFNEFDKRDRFCVKVSILRDEEVDNYIAIIVQKSNPKLNDILRDFDEFIGFFDTKPE